MEAVAFENKIIEGHPFYNVCGKTLDAVSKKDYPKDEFFDKSILCLDMDECETKARRGTEEETVDAVIGIKNHCQNRFTSQRLLLVELRMKYRSMNNMSQSKLEDKVRHTRALLGGGVPVESKSWFIFNNDIIEQAKRWFADMSRAGGAIKDFMPLSTDMFNACVKRDEDFPYKPVTDLIALRNELYSCVSAGNLPAFYDKADWWKKEAYAYKHQKNNDEEFHCIMNAIQDIWEAFRSVLQMQILSDEDKFYVELTDENLCV